MDEGGVGERSAEVTGYNKVALNEVAVNKVALNKVALNAIGINKVALNALGLNKVALNEVDLNKVALNKVALNQIDLTLTATGWTSTLHRDYVAVGESAWSHDVVDHAGGAELSWMAEDALLDIFEKSARCINADGVSTPLQVNGVHRRTAEGMFGLGEMMLTPRQFLGAFMACLAVWANDQPKQINVTAELPGARGVVVTTEEWAAGFQVPGVSVAYKVRSLGTVVVNGQAMVELDGYWLWNSSRHESWWLQGGVTRRLRRAMSWYGAYGRRNLGST
jgi:hypothetical protein